MAAQLDRAGFNMNGTPYYEVIDGLKKGRASAIALLQQAIKSLEDKISESGEPAAEDAGGKTLRAILEGPDLHCSHRSSSSAILLEWALRECDRDAVRALKNNLVRLHSGEEGDGTSLMETVFSPRSLFFVSTMAATQVGPKDEQKGFMMMFSGLSRAPQPASAPAPIKDDPERALEFIAFVSLLAKLLDGSKK